MSLKLHTIIASTRPGRVGKAIGEWFNTEAAKDGRFEARLIDLADYNLPIFDEPQHPILQQYQHAHTKAWARSVDEADAFVFVTPEHNYGPPASLVNALSYLSKEWQYKPASFVSYGGISGGLRAVQMEKQILTTLKVVPLPEQVVIPNFFEHLDENGAFKPNPFQEQSVTATLNELHRWTQALKPLREPAVDQAKAA